MSTDMGARAFHARSVDPVTFNRVLLQPNVLKGRYLTKIIRYASQLTVDGEAAAQVMRDHVANGTTSEHPGVQDIQNDPSMSDSLKASFLEMYIEGAQENQFPYFSTRHATMLSFRYAVDGVALPPYTPLAIWRDTVMGEGRIPYPKLNREGVDKTLYGLNNPLPEAIALQTLKEESVTEFANNPRDFLDYWERPLGVLDIFDSEYNCSVSNEAYHQQMMRFKYQLDFYVGDRPFPGAVGHFTYTQGSDEQVLSVVTMRLDTHTLPKNIDKHFGDRMKAEMRDVALKQLSKDLSEYITDYQGTLSDALSKAQRQFGTQTVEQVLPYMAQDQWSTGVQADPRKTKDRQQFTKRVTKVNAKGIQRGNTRLLFYRPQPLSRLAEAHQVTTPFWRLDFQKTDRVEMPLQGDPVRYNQDLNELDNIDVDSDAFQYWMHYGGMKDALEAHDQYVTNKLKNRESLYQFPGTNAAHELLRSSGIHVKRGYKSQLTDLLKRTEIMDSMGAFDFQNWSFEKLKAYPNGTFTMSEHRMDKTKVMREIRAQRNLSRRETRAQLSMSEPELGLQCFKTHWPRFLEEVLQVADLYVHAGYASSVEMAYNFDEVNLATKAQSARLWLDMHQSKLSNLPSLFELTMGKALSKALLNSPSHFAEANALISRELPSLLDALTTARDRWHPLLTNLRAQLPEWQLQAEQAPSTLPNMHKAFYDVVSTLHPTAEALPFSVWGFNDSFRPRAPEFALKMGLKLAKINQIDAWTKGLETDVDLTLRKLKRPVAQNLSLADRMRALKQ
ncbi:hypothetical protein AB6D11_00790 [Vibrio splendidus]